MTIIKSLCVLIAAIMLGRWFLGESRRLKAIGRPWYAVYLSLPGLIIIAIVILLPLLRRFL